MKLGYLGKMFTRDDHIIFMKQVIPLLGYQHGLQLLRHNQFIDYFFRFRSDKNVVLRSTDSKGLKLTLGQNLFRSYQCDFHQVLVLTKLINY